MMSNMVCDADAVVPLPEAADLTAASGFAGRGGSCQEAAGRLSPQPSPRAVCCRHRYSHPLGYQRIPTKTNPYPVSSVPQMVHRLHSTVQDLLSDVADTL